VFAAVFFVATNEASASNTNCGVQITPDSHDSTMDQNFVVAYNHTTPSGAPFSVTVYTKISQDGQWREKVFSLFNLQSGSFQRIDSEIVGYKPVDKVVIERMSCSE